MPASGSASDDVVMRLILKGQEPAEAARFARMGIDAVRAEYQAGAQKIQDAFKASHEAQTKEAQKAAKDQIRESQQATKAVVQALKEVEREQAKLTRGMSTNWRRTMEDLENVAVVATTAWNVILGGAGRLKSMGDEIAKVTNIYGSLKGSIDKMREATGGQIADIDLITTKNRAVQKELALTDEQFAMVAAGADIFADALGTDTKEALDQLIDGLATGRTKMLASAGVIVDTEKAFEEYAKKIGISSDRLSEHDKRVATVEASLRALDKKLVESAGGVESFADKWEKANAQIANLKNEGMIVFGEVAAGITSVFLKDIPDAITGTILRLDILIAKFKDAMTFGKAGYGGDVKQKESVLNAFLQNLTDEHMASKDASAKKIADAQARLELDRTGKGNPYDASKAVGGGTKPGGTAKKPTLEFTGIERLLDAQARAEAQIRANDLVDSSKAESINALIARLEDVTNFGSTEGMTNARLGAIDAQFAGGTFTAEQRAAFTQAQGKSAQSLRFKQASGVSLRDAKGSANLDEDFIKNLQAEIDSSREKAGGGILGQLLFGDDTSLDETYDKLDKFKQTVISAGAEMESMLTHAGGSLAAAFGQSAAAALADNKNIGTAFKDLSRQIIVSLSAQAFTLGAMEVALAAKDAAFGNFPGAAGHLAAAGLFGAVGTAAGLSASMISKPTAASAPATSSRSAPSYASGGGGGGSSGSGGGGDMTMVFNINGLIGDSEAVVRAIGRGVDEYRRKTGRDPWGNN